MEILGKTPYYNSYFCHSWNNFYDQFENFLTVNNIDNNEKKKEFLLNGLSSFVYTTLRHCCYPNEPRTLQYQQLIDMLQAQFHGSADKPSFQCRRAFYSAEQMENESVMQWYQRLLRQSENCEFGQRLETVVMDKFVCGMRPSAVLDVMLKQRLPVSMDELLRTAENAEKLMA